MEPPAAGPAPGSPPPGPPVAPGQSDPATEEKLREIEGRKSGEAKPDDVKPDAKTERFRAETLHEIILRYLLAAGMFALLCSEIYCVICVLDKQGRGVYHLADWLIGLLISVVFVQTVWIFQVIATHLYPKGEGKMALHPVVPGANLPK